MKHRHPYGALATLCVEVFFLTTFSAQESTHRPRIPVVQDWSQGKIIFTRDGLLQHPELLSREPRVLHQAMQRWQGPNSDVFRGVDPKQTALTSVSNQQDWNVNLKGRLSPH
ncbi:MAG TPA: hypothetical protein VGV15_14150, partial [Terriglobales bacterium]|nr:hypothetical protein [Terriglobales bacterium]